MLGVLWTSSAGFFGVSFASRRLSQESCHSPAGSIFFPVYTMLPDKMIFNMNQSRHTSTHRLALLSLLVLESLLPSSAHGLAFHEVNTVPALVNEAKVDTDSSARTTSRHAIARRQQAEGSECPEEGQWNCMTTRWQRCAAGHWSVTMDMSEGTTCSPSGLTYDLTLDHGDSESTSDAPPSAGAPSQARDVASIGRSLAVTGALMVFGVWRGMAL